MGVALAIGVLEALALEPLTWDEAYRLAEQTLANMTEPVIELTGLCDRQASANNLFLQNLGHLSNGSPLYGAGGHFLYFEPNCDGDKKTKPRWILSEKRPADRLQNLDQHDTCGPDAHVKVGADERDKPPAGQRLWTMPCGWEGQVQEILVNLREVSSGEKYSLLRGVGWQGGSLQRGYYVGGTEAIPRLGIPSLNMQDAAAGFRTYWPELVGTVTVLPSLLAMSATWNAGMVREYGRVVGREFRGKGANVVLGPSINVHRVARNGRNFEYLSGEDPMLGSVLAAAYVQGVQSEGVAAVVKHWVFNEQETIRGSMNAEVDNKTAWELYFPPFQAAIDAGAVAAMCSYNKVHGDFSCNSHRYLDVLHRRMGFRGFVMSDWWANHRLSLPIGLDQEMPGSSSGAFFSTGGLSDVLSEVIDRAATRVLAAMHRLRLFSTTTCSPPYCEDYFRRKVTTPEHLAFARRAAAESVVLLKNDGALLPLRRGLHLGVVGSAASAASFDPNGIGQGEEGDWATGDYYSGGGSGHVAGHAVTVIAGLRAQAADNDIRIDASLSDDIGQAVEIAKSVDVAIVVLGTTSGESRDRETLALDGDADALVEAVAKAARKVVVLVMAPGAVVMPWRHSADAIAIMFLGGQETGSAWADIVFGSKYPVGRLPIMLPETEADTIPPSMGPQVKYSEALATSYRNSKFRAAYPFGHGLTYTSFELPEPETMFCGFVEGCRFRLFGEVRNVGSRAGSTVVQVYLQFSASSGQPAPVLKAFKRTGEIKPGSAEQYTIDISENDTRYWNATADAWMQVIGIIIAHVGESQQDIRHSMRLCPDQDCLRLLSAHERIMMIGSFLVAITLFTFCFMIVVNVVGGSYQKQRELEARAATGQSDLRSASASLIA